VRQRVVDNLAHVDPKLARKVAEPLGIALPDPKAAAGRAGFRDVRIKLALEASAALSMEGGTTGIATRKVAVLVAGGVEVGALRVIQQALHEAGASSRILAAHLGFVATSSGQQLAVDHTFANMPSVMFDAVLVPGGAASAEALARDGDAVHYALEAYKHCKTLCVIGEGVQLLRTLGIGAGEGGPAVVGVLIGKNDPQGRAQLAQDFIAAIARHRHWMRPNIEAIPA
jgi:catalase